MVRALSTVILRCDADNRHIGDSHIHVRGKTDCDQTSGSLAIAVTFQFVIGDCDALAIRVNPFPFVFVKATSEVVFVPQVTPPGQEDAGISTVSPFDVKFTAACTAACEHDAAV